MEDQKSIGLLGAVSIGIGGTIGPSMFVILGFAASMAHYYVFISIILAGIIALAIGLIYAELATTFPEMGGGYFYIREAFGGFISFFAGFSLWIGYMAYGAVCALGFGYILATFFPIDPLIPAVIIVVLFFITNIRGAKGSIGIQQLLTVILILSFLLIIVAGFTNTHATPPKESILGNMAGIFRAAAFLSIAFFGFEPIGVLAGRIRNPGKIIPRAILLSLISCILIYTLTAYVSVATVGWISLSKTATPLSLVASRLLGSNGFVIIGIAGICATVSSLNVAMSSGAYVLYAMANDYFFPRKFTELHPRFGTPVNAFIVTFIFMELFILSGMVEYITHVTDFGVLIALAMVSLAALNLRIKRVSVKREFKAPMFPVLPLLVSILVVALAFILEFSAIILWLGMLLGASIVFLLNHLTLEKRKYVLSGFLLASAFLAIFAIKIVCFSTETPTLRKIILIVDILLILEVIVLGIASVILLYPVQALILYFRGKKREILPEIPRKISIFSEIVDDTIGILLVIFAALNMIFFYGLLHGFIKISADIVQAEAVFKSFLMIVLVMSGIFEAIVALFFIKRKSILQISRI